MWKCGKYHFAAGRLDDVMQQFVEKHCEINAAAYIPLLQHIPPRRESQYLVDGPGHNGVRLYLDVEQYVPMDVGGVFDAGAYTKQLIAIVGEGLTKEFGEVPEKHRTAEGVVGDCATRVVDKTGVPPFKISFHMVWPGVLFQGKTSMKAFVTEFVHARILEDAALRKSHATASNDPHASPNPCVDLAVYCRGHQALSLPFSHVNTEDKNMVPCRRPFDFVNGKEVSFNDAASKIDYLLDNIVSHAPDLNQCTKLATDARGTSKIVNNQLDWSLFCFKVASSSSSPSSSSSSSSSPSSPSFASSSSSSSSLSPSSSSSSSSSVEPHDQELKRAAAKVLTPLLSKERATTYETWSQVGFVLGSVFKNFSPGEPHFRTGLLLFQQFSMLAWTLYEPEACEQLFKAADGRLGLGSLLRWARADAGRMVDSLLACGMLVLPNREEGVRQIHAPVAPLPMVVRDVGPRMVENPCEPAEPDWIRVRLEEIMDTCGLVGIRRQCFNGEVVQSLAAEFQERWTRTADPPVNGDDGEDIGDSGSESDPSEDDTDGDKDNRSDSERVAGADRRDSRDDGMEWTEKAFSQEKAALYDLQVAYMNRFFCYLTGGTRAQPEVLETRAVVRQHRIWKDERVVTHMYYFKNKVAATEAFNRYKFPEPAMIVLDPEPEESGNALDRHRRGRGREPGRPHGRGRGRGEGGRRKPAAARKKPRAKVKMMHCLELWLSVTQSQLGRVKPKERRCVTFEPEPAQWPGVIENDNVNLFIKLGVPHPPPGSRPSMSRAELTRRIEPILKHFCRQICDEDYESGGGKLFEYLKNFFAKKYREPWLRMEVVLVLCGLEGVGKTYLGHLLGYLMGEQHYIYRLGSKPLGEEFGVGSQEVTNLLTVYDEFGALSADDLSTLKGKVTAATRVVNEKFVPKIAVPNHTTVMMMTNTQNAMTHSETQRRFLHLNPRPDFGGPKTPESKAYFEELWACSPELFAEYLWHYVPTDDFDPGVLPWTPGDQTVLERSVSGGSKPLEWVISQLQCPAAPGLLLDDRWHAKTAVSDAYLTFLGMAPGPDVHDVVRTPAQRSPAQPGLITSFMTPPSRRLPARTPTPSSSASTTGSSRDTTNLWKVLTNVLGDLDSGTNKFKLDTKRTLCGTDRVRSVRFPTVYEARDLFTERVLLGGASSLRSARNWEWTCRAPPGYAVHSIVHGVNCHARLPEVNDDHVLHACVCLAPMCVYLCVSGCVFLFAHKVNM